MDGGSHSQPAVLVGDCDPDLKRGGTGVELRADQRKLALDRRFFSGDVHEGLVSQLEGGSLLR